MTAMEDLMQAALAASDEKREMALRVLRDTPHSDTARTSWPEPYLTLRETARRLGVSACSLWRWKVPGHEIGGRRRYRLSEVMSFLESTSPRSTPSTAHQDE